MKYLIYEGKLYQAEDDGDHYHLPDGMVVRKKEIIPIIPGIIGITFFSFKKELKKVNQELKKIFKR